MPCYDSRDDQPRVDLEREMRAWVHNSPVAQMLCEVMGILEREQLIKRVSWETYRWWCEHQRRDAAKQ